MSILTHQLNYLFTVIW